MADYGYAQTAPLGGTEGQKVSAAPRSIASAIGRIDGLNARLAKAREHLATLSDQIGGPRPTDGEAGGDPKVQPIGAVARLNDATEHAHSQMSDIENLLGSIGRALG